MAMPRLMITSRHMNESQRFLVDALHTVSRARLLDDARKVSAPPRHMHGVELTFDAVFRGLEHMGGWTHSQNEEICTSLRLASTVVEPHRLRSVL